MFVCHITFQNSTLNTNNVVFTSEVYFTPDVGVRKLKNMSMRWPEVSDFRTRLHEYLSSGSKVIGDIRKVHCQGTGAFRTLLPYLVSVCSVALLWPKIW
jgi:hypothetical protein